MVWSILDGLVAGAALVVEGMAASSVVVSVVSTGSIVTVVLVAALVPLDPFSADPVSVGSGVPSVPVVEADWVVSLLVVRPCSGSLGSEAPEQEAVRSRAVSRKACVCRIW